jgi:hypothetical protein
MRLSYAVLVGLVLAAGGIYALFDEGWIRDWSSNIGAGLMGSLVIILLIDQVLETRRLREQQRVRTVALSQLRTPLMRHVLLLANWYKASVASVPEEPPRDIPQLFAQNYAETIGSLDFSKPGPTLPPLDWFKYSSQELDFFKINAERVVDKYAMFLDVRLIELVEGVAGSSLVSMMIEFGRVDIPQFDKQHGYQRPYNIFAEPTMKEELLRHFGVLLELVAYFNENSREKIRLEELSLWRDDVSPKIGSGRVA